MFRVAYNNEDRLILIQNGNLSVVQLYYIVSDGLVHGSHVFCSSETPKWCICFLFSSKAQR